MRRLVLFLSKFLPSFFIRWCVQLSARRMGLALCLHRVGAPRSTDPNPGMTMPAEDLDELLELLAPTPSPNPNHSLTLAFDDGYLDAALYMESRAPHWNQVQWLYCLCPQKTERSIGFRWDVYESNQAWFASQGMGFQDALFKTPQILDTENAREDLRQAAQDERFALAPLALVRELCRHPNVTLANHTNSHFRQTDLTLEESQRDLTQSHQDFERLFGPCQDFAFSFGTPGLEFGLAQVQTLRALGPFRIWTTEGRPYHPSEDKPGAVLPRFPIDCTLSPKFHALFIALKCLQWRLTGRDALQPYRSSHS